MSSWVECIANWSKVYRHKIKKITEILGKLFPWSNSSIFWKVTDGLWCVQLLLKSIKQIWESVAFQLKPLTNPDSYIKNLLHLHPQRLVNPLMHNNTAQVGESNLPDCSHKYYTFLPFLWAENNPQTTKQLNKITSPM